MRASQRKPIRNNHPCAPPRRGIKKVPSWEGIEWWVSFRRRIKE
jgi:hypothetical protein